MEMSKKTKKAGVLAGIRVIIIVILGIFLPGLFQQSEAVTVYPEDHLFVESTYLLKTSETNETVNVTCTPYLTNIWEKESGNIKIIVYVVQTSNNVADYKNTLEYGKILADSTAELEIPIVLSENSYKIDMLIFENGKLVLKGSLTLRAYQNFIYDESGVLTDQYWTLENTYNGFEKVSHEE